MRTNPRSEREVDQTKVLAPPTEPRIFGVFAGLVSGAVAVAIGLVIAGIITVVSPIDAVGSVVIDHVPLGIKEFAVNNFGTSDKLALRIGIYTILAIAAMALGLLAVNRPVTGAAGIGVFGIVGMLAASSRPSQPTSALFPSLIGAALGAPLLYYLATRIRPIRSIEIPGRSRVPLGMDRRRFLITSGGAAAVAVVAGAGARALENNRVSTLDASRPAALPPVSSSTPAGGRSAGTSGSSSGPPASSSSGPPVSSSSGPAVGAGADPVTPSSNPLDAANVDSAIPFITPNAQFYRIDTAQSFPNINVKTWKVDIKGMVDKPISLSYADISAMPQVERTITMTCVSNDIGGDLIGTAVFQGVLLKHVTDMVGIHAGAEQVFGTSVDGFTCGFPVSVLQDGRDAMIAIGMNGEALPLAHGFPARIVVPGLYGYVSGTKWVQSLEMTTWDQAEGYWIPRGWSRDGPIKTQSRIDVPRRGDKTPAGTVRVAGVAWAQHRGIEKVEVNVDRGPWQLATLGADVTDDAWRQWYIDVTMAKGNHSVQVRATDKTGATQTKEVTDVAPDGATGYHTRTIGVS